MNDYDKSKIMKFGDKLYHLVVASMIIGLNVVIIPAILYLLSNKLLKMQLSPIIEKILLIVFVVGIFITAISLLFLTIYYVISLFVMSKGDLKEQWIKFILSGRRFNFSNIFNKIFYAFIGFIVCMAIMFYCINNLMNHILF